MAAWRRAALRYRSGGDVASKRRIWLNLASVTLGMRCPASRVELVRRSSHGARPRGRGSFRFQSQSEKTSNASVSRDASYYSAVADFGPAQRIRASAAARNRCELSSKTAKQIQGAPRGKPRRRRRGEPLFRELQGA